MEKEQGRKGRRERWEGGNYWEERKGNCNWYVKQRKNCYLNKIKSHRLDTDLKCSNIYINLDVRSDICFKFALHFFDLELIK